MTSTMAADKNIRIGTMSLKNAQGALDRAKLEEIAQAFGAGAFIETGTFLGDSAASAAEVFPEVHTIELSQSLYLQASARFAQDPSVHVYFGDSSSVLPSLVRGLTGRALFWLDGHYSEGVTAKGDCNTPIFEELAAIQRHSSVSHILLIDDISLFDAASAARETGSSLHGYPTFDALRKAMPQGYSLVAIGDVALAFPSGEGVTVSPFLDNCTISRLFDGAADETAVRLESVFEAEQGIANADPDERQALESWLQQSAAREAHGLGGHFRLWQGLALNGNGRYGEACVEFEKALRLGLTHWRVWWYLAQAAHRAGFREVAQEATQMVARLAPAMGLPAEYQEYVASSESGGVCEELRRAGVWREGQPLRLHLGCGEQRFAGYVNIDYPASEHNVMTVRPDFEADITRLGFPDGSVDEIRLHHVFEHFNRVTALAMLVKWHQWLKIGGRLHIETPDLMGSAQTLTSQAPWSTKMGVVRHLAGDQAAEWAYHIEHWFPERFRHTLEAFGYDVQEASSESWAQPPHLSNVRAIAVKARDVTPEQLLAAADALLRESMISPVEAPTYEVWRRQLREALQPVSVPAAATTVPASIATPSAGPSLPPLPAPARPLAEIHNFNQRERDRWMQARAASVPDGSRVLDVGAGTCPYRQLFTHCDYRTHDFKQYEGVKLGNTHEYGHIDYVSDVASIPAPDASFDLILCTEVLEHVPEPIAALREMARLLRPGGRLLVTAPLASGLHQLPFHFYGGYTPGWYQHFGAVFGLHVREITPNGGFFRHLAQECARVSWTLPDHAHLHGANLGFVQQLFGDWLPQYLFALEDGHMAPQFTVGYHVEAVKSRDVAAVQTLIDQDPCDPALHVEAALACLAANDRPRALRFYEDACELGAEHPALGHLHAYYGITGEAK